MKRKLTSGIFTGIALFSLSCNTKPTGDTALSGTDSMNQTSGYATQAEWGKHLVTITGCGDCHTPKKMTGHGPVDDTALAFSGAQPNRPLPDIKQPGVAATYDQTAWVGPWGKSFAANITSDSTGIGLWKEAQFMNCLKKGLFKGLEGSRPLMPPMPWQDYSNMSDPELKAIFAYLRSVKPIRNNVPAYEPPVATR